MSGLCNESNSYFRYAVDVASFAQDERSYPYVMGSPLLRDGGDLLQQIGLFLSLEKVEHADKFYKTVVGARLLQHLWKKLTREEEIEEHRNEALLAIAEYVKKNPRATEEQILKEVQTQIDAFVQKIQ